MIIFSKNPKDEGENIKEHNDVNDTHSQKHQL